MPGLLPIILATTHLMLVADAVPQLNIEPSCRAAGSAAVAASADRNESACMRDEQAARGTLEKEWPQYTTTQRSQCVQLSTLGGSPSYVELLTCLELGKQSTSLPAEDRLDGGGQIER
jgi:hypothetical protein